MKESGEAVSSDETDETVETVQYGGQTFQSAKSRRRGRETVRDMVISLAVVGAGVAVLLLVTWRPHPPAGPVVVDWRATASAASHQAKFPIETPRGLSDQWKATSARLEPLPSSGGRTVWHLGFVTPENGYAGVEQSDAEAAGFIGDTLKGAQPHELVTIGGQTWQVYGAGSNGFRSLVNTGSGSTVIVTGSASDAELRTLAGSLSTPR